MREIKFRAWYEGKNVMVPFAAPDHMPLMQFTGLHDKNGKEIYEGDVVEYDNTGFKERAVVTWDYKALNNLETFYLATLEVIGNIYENGSLLTDKGSHDTI